MAEKKSLKTALLLSILMLAICVASMIGSTYAWFSDTVTNERNQIKVGSLDVDLEFSRDGEKWYSVQNDTHLFDESAQMTPGSSQMVLLRIRNNGSLHLKYQLTMNIIKEIGSTNMLNQEFKMSDYMMVGVLDHEELQKMLQAYAVSGTEASYANMMATYNLSPQAIAEKYAKTRFSEAVNLLKLEPSTAGSVPNPNPTLTEAYLTPQGGTDDAHVFALIVYTPAKLDQEINFKSGYNKPQICFGIDVVAGQRHGDEAESDSFGSDYDVNANYPSALSQDVEAGIEPWPQHWPAMPSGQ